MTPPPANQPDRDPLEAIASRAETARSVQRVVPWVASVGLHAGLVVLGFFFTWTIVSLTDDQNPARVAAEFYALTYEPLVTMEAEPEPQQETLAPRNPAVENLSRPLEAPAPAAFDPAPTGMADFAPAPATGAARFAGLTTTNARRIVYVIDASGSMIRSMPVVIEELARSLSDLAPPQQVGIIFFQRNESVMVPPAGTLVAATPSAKLQALQWIDRHVAPAGRSNPRAALEQALALEPDVVFLLSENITGSGRFELDQQDLLELLETLNPADARTGRRRAQIQCVQFLDPDPLETMRKIAALHGGPEGYTLLDRARLGLEAP